MPRRPIYTKPERAKIARAFQDVFEQFEGEVETFGEYLPEGKARNYPDGSGRPRQEHVFTTAEYQTRLGAWRVGGRVYADMIVICTRFPQSPFGKPPRYVDLPAVFRAYAGDVSASGKWNAYVGPNEKEAFEDPLTPAYLFADALREAFEELGVPKKLKEAA